VMDYCFYFGFAYYRFRFYDLTFLFNNFYIIFIINSNILESSK
jgi:hypothetical protein